MFFLACSLILFWEIDSIFKNSVNESHSSYCKYSAFPVSFAEQREAVQVGTDLPFNLNSIIRWQFLCMVQLYDTA